MNDVTGPNILGKLAYAATGGVFFPLLSGNTAIGGLTTDATAFCLILR